MLDIKVIRTETERVKKALARRKEVVDIDALLALDNERREALFEVEKKKNAQNEESKKIPLLKKEGKDVSAIFEDMKKLSAEIKEYDILITQVNLWSGEVNKSMTIEVTDPSLLDETGGIIQGMSGSPILQNGKLIGAVTHVFVNNPTKGYGIFAESMINESE